MKDQAFHLATSLVRKGMPTNLLRLLAIWRRQPTRTVAWEDVLAKSTGILSSINHSDGSSVLCATSTGAHTLVTLVDSLVAMGLYLRGANPHFLLCDQVLAACVTRPATTSRSCNHAGEVVGRRLPTNL